MTPLSDLFSKRRPAAWLAAVGAVTLLASLAFLSVAAPAHAQEPGGNETCLACHSDPALAMTLADGESLSLFVDAGVYQASLHGAANLQCTDCHTDIQTYPHPAVSYADRRDVTLQNSQSCESCHGEQYRETQDSIHQRELAAGNRNAPTCSDCHTAHAVTDPAAPRTNIPETCAQCHSTIYDDYIQSVHGSTLTDGNADVPTCVDCHGVHQIGDPTTAAFRLKSPALCAECHTDASIMSRYGLSTNVLNTYIADFHGTTVELFAKQHPDQATNKPVCYDCHGIHDIKSAQDPASQVAVAGNLLRTCQQCHPDATAETFTASWMSHYEASPDKYPLVFYVNLFYWILIPATIGALGLYIAADIWHRVRSRAAAKPRRGEA